MDAGDQSRNGVDQCYRIGRQGVVLRVDPHKPSLGICYKSIDPHQCISNKTHRRIDLYRSGTAQEDMNVCATVRS